MPTSKLNPYKESFKDPRWQKLRLECYGRDSFTCRICGDSKSTLNLHHTYYVPWAEGAWDYPPESLITLCESCHEAETAELKTVKPELLAIASSAGFLTSEDLRSLSYLLECLKTAKTKEDMRPIFFHEIEEYWRRG